MHYCYKFEKSTEPKKSLKEVGIKVGEVVTKVFEDTFKKKELSAKASKMGLINTAELQVPYLGYGQEREVLEKLFTEYIDNYDKKGVTFGPVEKKILEFKKLFHSFQAGKIKNIFLKAYDSAVRGDKTREIILGAALNNALDGHGVKSGSDINNFLYTWGVKLEFHSRASTDVEYRGVPEDVIKKLKEIYKEDGKNWIENNGAWLYSTYKEPDNKPGFINFKVPKIPDEIRLAVPAKSEALEKEVKTLVEQLNVLKTNVGTLHGQLTKVSDALKQD